MIYLDNAATTKMFEGGVDIYKKYACQSFFNPSAGYYEAISVMNDLNTVREKIKKVLSAVEGQIVFTSGATESNNLALLGSRRNGNWEYVFSEGEHPSVYNVAKYLESQGHKVHYIGLTSDGQIDYNQLENVVNEKTRLISAMHVSNETGAINNLKLLDEIRKKKSPKAILHIDGVQAFCKLPLNLDLYHIDLYTISAHKFHGPKGVGALYVRNPSIIKNIVYGGGQEKGLRSGTENTAGIMAMGYAIDNIDIQKNYQIVSNLKDRLIENINDKKGISVLDVGSPYIIGVSFEGVNGETLMRALQAEGVLVGVGSACSTKYAGNRVLEKMGFKLNEIKTHIRISFCEDLTFDDIDKASKKILQTYYNLLEKLK